MPSKFNKRKPFQLQAKSKTLTGGERERSKQNIAWILALSKNDIEKIKEKLSINPSLANIVCHFTGLAPIHWAVKNNNHELVKLLFR